MGALEDLLPFLQVNELLGQDVHVAPQADPLMHRGDGRAVAAQADEFVALQEGRGHALAQFLALFLQDRQFPFQLGHLDLHFATAAGHDLALFLKTLVLLGDGLVLGPHELQQFQDPGLFLIPLVFFEGDLFEHGLVFDVAFDFHETLAAFLDAALHLRHFLFRLLPLLFQVFQFLGLGVMFGLHLLQGRVFRPQFLRQSFQALGDLPDYLVQFLQIYQTL